MAYALSPNYSVSHSHSTKVKIYENLWSWHYDDLHFMAEKTGSERFGDSHRTHYQNVSGAGFAICLSVFMVQCLLTPVVSYVYSQALPFINEGTLCSSFLNTTCNTRERLTGWAFLSSYSKMILGSRLCHVNKTHQTVTWDAHGRISKKRHHSPSLLFQFTYVKCTYS